MMFNWPTPFAFRRRRGGPPDKDNINRRFTRRDGNVLIDSVAGRDAEVYGEASYFGGDGVVATDRAYFSTTGIIKFKIIKTTASGIIINRPYENRSPIGINTGFLNLGFSALPGENIGYSLIDGTNNVEVNYNTNTVTINGNISTGVNQGGFSNIGDYSVIGARGNAGGYATFLNTSLWEVESVGELFIPLPHSGVGFDADNNTIPLTVEGGVTSAIIKGGSLWNHDHGCVERNPELVVNGDFEDGLNGWSAVSGAILDVTDNVLSIKSPSGDLTAAAKSTLLTSLEIGESYVINCNSVSRTSGNRLQVGTAVGLGDLLEVVNFDGIISRTFIATQPNVYCLLWSLDQSEGEAKFSSLSLYKSTPSYIPNKPDNTPAFPLEEGDTLIPAAPNFINASPFKLKLFTPGDTDFEYAFFDKSNATIWKPEVRASDNYAPADPGIFDMTELQQQWIYDNIEDAYKYHWWSKDFKDLFFYSTALPYPACAAKKYVGLGEILTTPEGTELPCKLDRPA